MTTDGTAEAGPPDDEATARPEYAERLTNLQQARWKQIIDVQAPYRWFLRRLDLGRTLDVGCGIGRNLDNLGGNAVGVDHNAEGVATCRARGFEAYTVDEFLQSEAAAPAAYDAVLFAHVLEHMDRAAAVALVQEYLPYLRRPGRLVLITPQERGFASDATHVELMDCDTLASIARECGFTVDRARSYPLPRFAGKWFTYNEFTVVATAR